MSNKIREAFTAAPEFKPPRRLVADDIATFLELKIPPRAMLLDPIIPSQGLAMLFAWRGIGKTHVALGMAYAVASGAKFLRWQAPEPRRVIYVDGEMPANAMQERIAAVVKGAQLEPPHPDYFRLITPDRQLSGIPNLASEEGQKAVEEWTEEGCDLLVLDNLSTLCGHGRENEAESWVPVQEWILNLRRKGLSVLLIHHAGKGGAQRGTSKREDVLDTVISMRRPDDYLPTEGARFIVEYEKARGLTGPAATPFEAKLDSRDGSAIWTMRDLEECTTERVAQLLNEGMKHREIATELRMGVGTVNRHKKKAAAQGLLSEGEE